MAGGELIDPAGGLAAQYWLMTGSPLASSSVRVHLIRGAIGLASLVAAFALIGPLGPAALLFLVVAGIAWRGCPSCWAIGLTQTRAAAACPAPSRRAASIPD